jgi:hypothetical protein
MRAAHLQVTPTPRASTKRLKTNLSLMVYGP